MHRCEGFTLLEAIIVMAILSIMMGGAMYVLLNGQQTFDEGSMTTFMESQATWMIDKMKDDISEGKVITSLGGWNYYFPCPNNSYSTLILQVPVAVGGNYWDPATGAVYWGADGQQGVASYYYLSLDVWPPVTLTESTDKKDWNQDGDLNDSFYLYNLYVYVFDPITWAFIRWNKVMSDIMISTNPWGYGDVDGDGTNDPIFTLLDKDGDIITEPDDVPSGNRIRLNFWLGGKLGAKGNPILVNTKTDIFLMNPQ